MALVIWLNENVHLYARFPAMPKLKQVFGFGHLANENVHLYARFPAMPKLKQVFGFGHLANENVLFYGSGGKDTIFLSKTEKKTKIFGSFSVKILILASDNVNIAIIISIF